MIQSISDWDSVTMNVTKYVCSEHLASMKKRWDGITDLTQDEFDYCDKEGCLVVYNPNDENPNIIYGFTPQTKRVGKEKKL